ncbi:hypothetical protein FRB93_010723 [Tulasnella sp. JGI-2019a]|nr:hypothetical protein FRB93_010723 [Tulasnella sp. JGI-2019a]
MASSLQESDWTNIGNADPAMAFSDPTAPGAQIDASERARSSVGSRVARDEPNEQDSLLPQEAPQDSGEQQHRREKATSAFWKAGRHWLVPFWLIASFSRGMTLAPRVEIYTSLACEAYYPDHPHHTNHNDSFLGESPLIAYYPLAAEALPINAFVYRNDTFPSKQTRHRPDKPSFPHGEDPAIATLPKERCYSDPVVQQHSAQLQMAVILIMGILSSLTTGWWGSVGDRIGRRRIMALSLMGYLFTDVMFLVCAFYAKALVPWGGHKLLLLGPVVEGLLGGWSTITAAVSAYVSDITPHGSRSHTFSTFQGLMFVGVATGPAFGSIILKYTNQILLIFLISVTISFVNCLYVTFIVPESLTQEARDAYCAAHAAKDDDPSVLAGDGDREALGVVASVRAWLRAFFAPLQLFAPHGKDWRLTYIAVAFSSIMLTAGGYPMKLLYAEHVFGWSAVELGNYLTVVGTLRAGYLLVTLPLLIKWLKPKHDAVPTDIATTSETTPLLQSDPATATGSPASSASSSTHTKAMILKDMEFDVRLAQLSLLMDALGYLVMVLTSSTGMFMVGSALSSLGGGAPPAIQSLSLCLLPNPREDAGKMFGAMSMMQSASSAIASPLLFGLVYSTTVDGFPAAIYVLSAALALNALVSLLLVRLKKHHHKKNQRGRSTRRKRLSGSATATREASADENSTHSV